ncbi:cation:proton antiporter [Virgibacillus sp. DJP39]|uniref:cation:proton antiporter n=1 Tax=Virgibacillus sp. DJP39 TaxID=3409790 RepID=UPI003BB725FF
MTTTIIIILLSIGYIIFTIDKKQNNFPVPFILLLTGIGLSFIPYFSGVHVTEHIIYNIFLPGLLFTSAYQFSAKALRKNARVIATLSTIGLIATAVLLGMVTYLIGGAYLNISLVGALLIASILTPTDPVSVVSILKQSTDDASTADVVEGESMINDGTSVVLFSVLSGMYVNGTAFELSKFLGDFFYVSIGGIVLGIIIGWLFSKLVHITHHKDYQVMLSIIIAYGGFHLAEHFGFSGVLATVTSGIMLSWEFNHTNKEDHYREALAGFWNVVEPTLLTLVFLLIGIEATEYLTHGHWVMASIVFLASIIIRFIIVSGTMQLFRGWRHIVDWKKALLISWSGIRGTMSVFLLLSLSTMASRSTGDKLLSLAFSVVVLSLVIQSIGIYPLSKWLASAEQKRKHPG